VIVIKLGGSKGIDLERFLTDLAGLEPPYVLVHGANVELDALMRELGVEHVLCTELAAEQGLLTGTIAGRTLWGPGKTEK